MLSSMQIAMERIIIGAKKRERLSNLKIRNMSGVKSGVQGHYKRSFISTSSIIVTIMNADQENE